MKVTSLLFLVAGAAAIADPVFKQPYRRQAFPSAGAGLPYGTNSTGGALPSGGAGVGGAGGSGSSSTRTTSARSGSSPTSAGGAGGAGGVGGAGSGSGAGASSTAASSRPSGSSAADKINVGPIAVGAAVLGALVL